MPTQILKTQNTIRFAQLDKVSDTLEKGTYVVNQDDRGEYYLTIHEELKLPEKIYGKNDEFINRVLKSYKALGRGIGVLLSGLKGAGKSVESVQLCQKSEQPILIVNQPFAGNGFSEFLSNLPCACTVFMDEFEKVYSSPSEKDSLLPILDGSVKTPHLFVLTSNSAEIGEFFISRPGRVRYHKEYFALDDKIIKEIVEDKLENKENTTKVLETLNKYHGLSIDSLTSLITEANIHNETPDQFAHIFNVQSQRPKFWDIQAEIWAWKLKPDLSKADLEKERMECLEEGDEGFENFYQKVKKKFRSTYSELLKGAYGREFLDVYLYSEEDKESMHIGWLHNIIKIEETREFIRITNEDGSVIYATPTSLNKVRSISH